MSEFRDETKNLVSLSRNAIAFYNNITTIRVMGGRVHTTDDVVLGREWFVVSLNGKATIRFQNDSDVDFTLVYIHGTMSSFENKRINSKSYGEITLNAYNDLLGIFIAINT